MICWKRSGYVASENYADEWKRKRIYMFFQRDRFEQRFEGDIYDVSDNGKHPVYRYAKALFLGV